MPQIKRVYAFFDGSNFYHHIKESYGITSVNFFHMSNELLKKNEKLMKIKYYNCPVSQQEDLEVYKNQQRFFQKIKSTPKLDLILGKLVKRQMKRININCEECGHQKSEILTCPSCKEEISILECHRYTEKGVDVKIAIDLLLHALNNKYDTALLFSGDRDYVPAIKYVKRKLRKKVVYCHFPIHRTYELKQVCSDTRLITKEMVENSNINS